MSSFALILSPPHNLVIKEFDVSNLRRHRTVTDAKELQSDEYLVDLILKHRVVRGQRQYSVKWRGYPRSQSSWVPRSELERRCADMVASYEDSIASRPRRNRLTLPAAAPDLPPRPEPRPPAAPVETTDDHRSHVARFDRGSWIYGR